MAGEGEKGSPATRKCTRHRKTRIGVPGDFNERAAVAVVAGVVGKAVVIVIAGTGDKALQQL